MLGTMGLKYPSFTAILLAPAERSLILAEMRGFVEAMRDVTGALVTRDIKAVARATAHVGINSTHEVSRVVMGKLPL